ncbi:hypothetical protein ACO0RG_002671 [Hanseniaspora osmophila]
MPSKKEYMANAYQVNEKSGVPLSSTTRGKDIASPKRNKNSFHINEDEGLALLAQQAQKRKQQALNKMSHQKLQYKRLAKKSKNNRSGQPKTKIVDPFFNEQRQNLRLSSPATHTDKPGVLSSSPAPKNSQMQGPVFQNTQLTDNSLPVTQSSYKTVPSRTVERRLTNRDNTPRHYPNATLNNQNLRQPIVRQLQNIDTYSNDPPISQDCGGSAATLELEQSELIMSKQNDRLNRLFSRISGHNTALNKFQGNNRIKKRIWNEKPFGNTKFKPFAVSRTFNSNDDARLSNHPAALQHDTDIVMRNAKSKDTPVANNLTKNNARDLFVLGKGSEQGSEQESNTNHTSAKSTSNGSNQAQHEATKRLSAIEQKQDTPGLIQRNKLTKEVEVNTEENHLVEGSALKTEKSVGLSLPNSIESPVATKKYVLKDYPHSRETDFLSDFTDESDSEFVSSGFSPVKNISRTPFEVEENSLKNNTQSLKTTSNLKDGVTAATAGGPLKPNKSSELSFEAPRWDINKRSEQKLLKDDSTEIKNQYSKQRPSSPPPNQNQPGLSTLPEKNTPTQNSAQISFSQSSLPKMESILSSSSFSSRSPLVKNATTLPEEIKENTQGVAVPSLDIGISKSTKQPSLKNGLQNSNLGDIDTDTPLREKQKSRRLNINSIFSSSDESSVDEHDSNGNDGENTVKDLTEHASVADAKVGAAEPQPFMAKNASLSDLSSSSNVVEMVVPDQQYHRKSKHGIVNKVRDFVENYGVYNRMNDLNIKKMLHSKKQKLITKSDFTKTMLGGIVPHTPFLNSPRVSSTNNIVNVLNFQEESSHGLLKSADYFLKNDFIGGRRPSPTNQKKPNIAHQKSDNYSVTTCSKRFLQSSQSVKSETSKVSKPSLPTLVQILPVETLLSAHQTCSARELPGESSARSGLILDSAPVESNLGESVPKHPSFLDKRVSNIQLSDLPGKLFVDTLESDFEGHLMGSEKDANIVRFVSDSEKGIADTNQKPTSFEKPENGSAIIDLDTISLLQNNQKYVSEKSENVENMAHLRSSRSATNRLFVETEESDATEEEEKEEEEESIICKTDQDAQIRDLENFQNEENADTVAVTSFTGKLPSKAPFVLKQVLSSFELKNSQEDGQLSTKEHSFDTTNCEETVIKESVKTVLLPKSSFSNTNNIQRTNEKPLETNKGSTKPVVNTEKIVSQEERNQSFDHVLTQGLGINLAEPPSLSEIKENTKLSAEDSLIDVSDLSSINDSDLEELLSSDNSVSSVSEDTKTHRGMNTLKGNINADTPLEGTEAQAQEPVENRNTEPYISESQTSEEGFAAILALMTSHYSGLKSYFANKKVPFTKEEQNLLEQSKTILEKAKLVADKSNGVSA